MTHRILAISLGGTIALEIKGGRAVATNGANKLVNNVILPQIEITWTTKQFINKDGVDISLGDLANLSQFINSKSPDFDGFIISTGTDSLEEVSYFLHEVFADRLNIVVTGAMRPPYSKDFDGNINFNFATTTCLSHIDKKRGVFVAISGHAIPAINVVKKSSIRLNSFEPIYDDSFNETSITQFSKHHHAPDKLLSDVSAFEAINIQIIAVSIGSKLNPLMFKGIDGCVISCPGAFSLPETMIDNLQKQAKRIPIVLASRCVHNEPIPENIYPGYLDRQESLGFLIRDYVGLSPHQSRLKLIFDTFRERQANALISIS